MLKSNKSSRTTTPCAKATTSTKQTARKRHPRHRNRETRQMKRNLKDIRERLENARGRFLILGVKPPTALSAPWAILAHNCYIIGVVASLTFPHPSFDPITTGTMSSDAIRATLAQWDFSVASQGFSRRESVVSPRDQHLPRVSSLPSLRKESSSQPMETDDSADDYFPRFNSSIGNPFSRSGTHWPSLMSINKDEEIFSVTRQTIPGHNLLPFPNTQAASDLGILNFYVEEPDTVYLEVKFPNMQPIILREDNVQKINEPAVVNFWRLSGSREYATGIGKRHVFCILGYRVFYLPNGGEREEHWIHWTGYRACEASWVGSDFARRAAPEMVQAFNSERRLSCYRDSTGEMFITKNAPRCSEMTHEASCKGCLRCGGGCSRGHV
ncbi:hypothetical protein FPANT_5494 [Fusarium pseudoanthophilum]|uniref:Uncharacterized protein n=1 Tax=Fusarium pseudoanthophilum TaxID=48495 RepID=A0A8H5P8N5_9HYPO|nr:hypothetical protein FPANT_5494 [Fusarium pseudoanthophilum]